MARVHGRSSGGGGWEGPVTRCAPGSCVQEQEEGQQGQGEGDQAAGGGHPRAAGHRRRRLRHGAGGGSGMANLYHLVRLTSARPPHPWVRNL